MRRTPVAVVSPLLRWTFLSKLVLLGIIALCGGQTSLAQSVTESKKAVKSTGEDEKQQKVEPGKSEDFLRLKKEDGKPVALETSITRFTGKNSKGESVTVDLIGVVHIAEGDYYKDLNKRFESYDALLYELVAPEGTRVPAGGMKDRGFNPVSGLQQSMQKMLELEFQLEHIDYNRENFVHADMSPTEFAESMEENDESLVKIFFKMLGQSMARQGTTQGGGELGMLQAYFSDDRAMALRRVMASQMQQMDMAMTMFEGNDGSTIITHRNKKALDVLKREIKDGKKELAVFYGAGHLPDMEKRLLEEFKFERKKREWLTAWRLTREDE